MQDLTQDALSRWVSATILQDTSTLILGQAAFIAMFVSPTGSKVKSFRCAAAFLWVLKTFNGRVDERAGYNGDSLLYRRVALHGPQFPTLFVFV